MALGRHKLKVVFSDTPIAPWKRRAKKIEVIAGSIPLDTSRNWGDWLKSFF